MNEHALPTWNDMVNGALDELQQAREHLGKARDWMASDWRPVGSELSDAEADSRTETFRTVREAKTLLDQLQRVLDDTRR